VLQLPRQHSLAVHVRDLFDLMRKMNKHLRNVHS
jgi:hypothetical protein